jgi:hypothetical protein
VIVELRAAPGRRAELKSRFEGVIATHGPGQPGFLCSTRYEVLDDDDMLVEVADRESAEARTAHVQQAAATGAYAPLLELLAAPSRVTVICRFPDPTHGVSVGTADAPTTHGWVGSSG